MPGSEYLLTVYDPSEGRLLRVDRFSSEQDLALHELEERDHYMRHPTVEIVGHVGRSAEEILASYRERARRDAPRALGARLSAPRS